MADLADLFEGQTLPSSAGDRRPIRVYSQDLPIIEGLDETEDRTEEIPEPYIIVRTNEGNIPDANSAQEIDLILVVCTYDRNPNRQGYRDVLHITLSLSNYAAYFLLLFYIPFQHTDCHDLSE